MSINSVREQRRRDTANRDLLLTIQKFETQQAECITRPATEDEMKMTGKRTSFKQMQEHRKNYRINISQRGD